MQETSKKANDELFIQDIKARNKKRLRHHRWRWYSLFCLCIMACGAYFIYDLPGFLETQLRPQLGIEETEYSLLYTVYAIPNVILPLIGGTIALKVGNEATLLVTNVLVTAGQIVFMFGGDALSFNTMIAGRVLFGLGAETFYTLWATVISEWFNDQEISLAMGLTATVPNLLATCSGIFTPTIVQNDGIKAGLGLGVIVCAISTLSVIGQVCLNWAQQSHDEKLRHLQREELLRAHDGMVDDEEEEEVEDAAFSWSNLLQLNRAYWLMAADVFLTQSLLIGQTSNGAEMMKYRFNFSDSASASIMTIQYFVCAVSALILGVLCDRYGRR